MRLAIDDRLPTRFGTNGLVDYMPGVTTWMAAHRQCVMPLTVFALCHLAGCTSFDTLRRPKADSDIVGQPKVVTRDVSLGEFVFGKRKPNRENIAFDSDSEVNDAVIVDVNTSKSQERRERQRKEQSRPLPPIVSRDPRSIPVPSDNLPALITNQNRNKETTISGTLSRDLPRVSSRIRPADRVSKAGNSHSVRQAKFDDAESAQSDSAEDAVASPQGAPQREAGRTSIPNPPDPSDELASDVPPSPDPVHVPLEGSEIGGNFELTTHNGKISLVARNASVEAVLNLLAQQQGLNLIAGDDVGGNISITLTEVPFQDALSAIVSIAGCTWTQQRGIVLVSKIGGESRGNPDVQGKIVQVFNLNFVSSVDLEHTIKGLLSPIGQIFITQTSPTDKRRTQELIVIEDVPPSVQRISQYVQQVDQPPRQVMIEAHVLEIDLSDTTTHGVNWQYVTKIAGSDIALSTVGFANPAASPASFFSLDGAHLHTLVQALKTTNTTKTLAEPKITVANGQEARIQIGSKLGYFVTTTTQTSTLQNVNFLNTGVLLRVTPQISNDGRVLMVVRPEVSTGSISAAGLPQTSTTEAETTVLLDDGAGMLIGGLIKESDNETQDKVPILGDVWLVGRLFQRRVYTRARSEVVIVLIPRIAPYTSEFQAYEQTKVMETNVPLFQNGLQPTCRPWDPAIPDAITNPRRLRTDRLSAVWDHPCDTNPKPLRFFFPTLSEEMFPPDCENCPQPLVLPPVNDVPPSPSAMPYDDANCPRP